MGCSSRNRRSNRMSLYQKKYIKHVEGCGKNEVTAARDFTEPNKPGRKINISFSRLYKCNLWCSYITARLP